MLFSRLALSRSPVTDVGTTPRFPLLPTLPILGPKNLHLSGSSFLLQPFLAKFFSSLPRDLPIVASFFLLQEAYPILWFFSGVPSSPFFPLPALEKGLSPPSIYNLSIHLCRARRSLSFFRKYTFFLRSPKAIIVGSKEAPFDKTKQAPFLLSTHNLFFYRI